MQKAIFLDRDGVINNPGENYYVYKISDFKFNSGIFESLKQYSEAGYILIVISNQGGISKGIYTKQQVEEVNKYMTDELKKHDINISETYFCPHHSDTEACICRKPDSLLIEKAVAVFNIDKKLSFLIGDSERDILAGEKAGIKSILTEKNGKLPDIRTLLRL